jgi:hypothetical protein
MVEAFTGGMLRCRFGCLSRAKAVPDLFYVEIVIPPAARPSQRRQRAAARTPVRTRYGLARWGVAGLVVVLEAVATSPLRSCLDTVDRRGQFRRRDGRPGRDRTGPAVDSGGGCLRYQLPVGGSDGAVTGHPALARATWKCAAALVANSA